MSSTDELRPLTWHKEYTPILLLVDATLGLCVRELHSPGLWMRSSSLTERALTTPPTWSRKPEGKDVRVKKGNSCWWKRSRSLIEWAVLELHSQSRGCWKRTNNRTSATCLNPKCKSYKILFLNVFFLSYFWIFEVQLQTISNEQLLLWCA